MRELTRKAPQDHPLIAPLPADGAERAPPSVQPMPVASNDPYPEVFDIGDPNDI